MFFSRMKSLLFFTFYYQPVNSPVPYWNFNPFCLDVLESYECEARFMVAKDDIPILLNALQIPAIFTSFSLEFNCQKDCST